MLQVIYSFFDVVDFMKLKNSIISKLELIEQLECNYY